MYVLTNPRVPATSGGATQAACARGFRWRPDEIASEVRIDQETATGLTHVLLLSSPRSMDLPILDRLQPTPHVVTAIQTSTITDFS